MKDGEELVPKMAKRVSVWSAFVCVSTRLRV